VSSLSNIEGRRVGGRLNDPMDRILALVRMAGVAMTPHVEARRVDGSSGSLPGNTGEASDARLRDLTEARVL